MTPQVVQGPVDASRYHYMYTRASDATGREGFSFVRTNTSNADEIGRLWVDERSPDYQVDLITGTVYLKRSDNEIAAMQFPEEPSD